jgi:hypothetical protein
MRIAERALAPCELGGSNRFANPQEYLLAALNACVTVGYVGQCAVRGIALDLPSPRYRAALDRGRARSRSGPVTVGTGGPLHPPHRGAADALRCELAYVCCRTRLAQAIRVSCRAVTSPGRLMVGFGTGFTGRAGMGKKPLSLASMRTHIAQVRALLRGRSQGGP